jgi:hypothetical protein
MAGIFLNWIGKAGLEAVLSQKASHRPQGSLYFVFQEKLDFDRLICHSLQLRHMCGRASIPVVISVSAIGVFDFPLLLW